MKKIWGFFSGKKTIIAAMMNYFVAWFMAKGWIDETDSILILGVTAVWTGVAVGHRTAKSINKKIN